MLWILCLKSGTFGVILINKKLYYFVMVILEEKIDSTRDW